MRSPTLELEPLLWFQFLEGKRLRRVGRLEEKGGGGQRVLLLSKPLFSILDHLFHRQEGHSLFPFSSLWKGFSLPCVSLCPVCIRLKSNSLNPNQFLLAIQQRSFHEWPGGSKGQKSTFLFACLSLNIKPGGLRPNPKFFFIYRAKGQVEEDSYILEVKLHQGDTAPHVKPQAPSSSHTEVEFFPGYNPGL